MNGSNEYFEFLDWLITIFKQFLGGISSWNNLIGYAILYIPLIRLVFRFLDKLIHIGNSN